jgi:hypothetical protein
MALAGSEVRADWEGSASVEHHSCSVSDGSRVQNDVGSSPEILSRWAPKGCPPFARRPSEIAPRAAKLEPAPRTRRISAAGLRRPGPSCHKIASG